VYIHIITFESSTCGTATTQVVQGREHLSAGQHRVMCELQWRSALVFMTPEWPGKPARGLKTNKEKLRWPFGNNI